MSRMLVYQKGLCCSHFFPKGMVKASRVPLLVDLVLVVFLWSRLVSADTTVLLLVFNNLWLGFILLVRLWYEPVREFCLA